MNVQAFPRAAMQVNIFVIFTYTHGVVSIIKQGRFQRMTREIVGGKDILIYAWFNKQIAYPSQQVDKVSKYTYSYTLLSIKVLKTVLFLLFIVQVNDTFVRNSSMLLKETDLNRKAIYPFYLAVIVEM